MLLIDLDISNCWSALLRLIKLLFFFALGREASVRGTVFLLNVCYIQAEEKI